MKQYIITVLLLLSGLYLIFFFLKNAPSEVAFKTINRETTYFVGEYFLGSPRSPELEELFIRQRNLALEKNSNLIVVNYESDTLKGRLWQFIGVLTHEKPLDMKNYGLEMSAGDYISTELSASALNTLTPEDIREKATNYAQATSSTIESTTSYEVYDSDGKLQVMFYLR